MAGSLVPFSTTTTTNNNSQFQQSSAIIDQWQVHYSRFINYSSINFPQSHPSLTSLSDAQKKIRRGIWSSTSDYASIKLIYEPSSSGSDDAVLVVSIPPWALEEHRISKMQFSWPQVSCVAGFPPRGSRAVFVSYKDNEGQIQKFALHFVAVSEAEKFMKLLKEILGNGSLKHLQCSQFNSELSSQDEVVPSCEPTYRLEEDQHTISADISVQPMIPSFDLNEAPEFQPQESSQDILAAETLSTFPPSFTQLLQNCQPAVDNVSVAVKPEDSEKDLRTQFLRYLEGTSLEGISIKEILATVEDVINELGDDLLAF